LKEQNQPSCWDPSWIWEFDFYFLLWSP